MDQRRQALIEWGMSELQRIDAKTDIFNPEQYRIEMVSGDASFRRYFRAVRPCLSTDPVDVNNKSDKLSWILVDAPPTTEDSQSFVNIARQWHQHGVNVPTVYALDLTQGFMLLEDFGDQLFWPAVHQYPKVETHVGQFYNLAIDELHRLHQVPADDLPAYDRPLLKRECELFRDWLCQQSLQIELSEADDQMLDDVFEQLIKAAIEQPTVTVHRDYHSRNIMLREQSNSMVLGLIDFQDAVAGPYSYDLVSLVRDCYVSWPQDWADQWLHYFWQTSEIIRQDQITESDFRRDVDWMGMQRHLKAAGIFARLNLRDGKSGYLADIPNTINYLLVAARRYPCFSKFANWLEHTLVPRLILLEPAP